MLEKGGFNIREPEQKAVIFYNQGKEELILSVKYQGEVEDFAWLVPLPEPPRIEESDFGIFELLDHVTSERNEKVGDGTEGIDEGVEVIEERTVGAFDLTTLEAEGAEELRGWLNRNGLGYQEEAESVFVDYIERGWCFVAMRVNPDNSGEAADDLREGTIDPLRFTFHAQQPIYPLYISSLNPGHCEVLIFVLGDEAYTCGGMEMLYANNWENIHLEMLKGYSEMSEELGRKGGCDVTKLRGYFAPEEMEDLYFQPAEPELLAQVKRNLVSVGGDGLKVDFWFIAIAILVLLEIEFIIMVVARYGKR
ncbi:MAG: DUF2330 domain-containing protein [Actinomycetota bacterium]|nr:DUF2330 domain-containing protein [Actinomycetota bacterium]